MASPRECWRIQIELDIPIIQLLNASAIREEPRKIFPIQVGNMGALINGTNRGSGVTGIRSA